MIATVAAAARCGSWVSGRVQRVGARPRRRAGRAGKATRSSASAGRRRAATGSRRRRRPASHRRSAGTAGPAPGILRSERDRVNPRIRENERGGRQHKDAADDGDHREKQAQCAVEVHGMRCSRRELVTHRAAAFLPGAMLAPAPSPYSRERERPLAAGRHATAAPPGAARPLPPAGNPSGETGARMTNGEQAELIRAISALGETLCRITG